MNIFFNSLVLPKGIAVFVCKYFLLVMNVFTYKSLSTKGCVCLFECLLVQGMCLTNADLLGVKGFAAVV